MPALSDKLALAYRRATGLTGLAIPDLERVFFAQINVNPGPLNERQKLALAEGYFVNTYDVAADLGDDLIEFWDSDDASQFTLDTGDEVTNWTGVNGIAIARTGTQRPIWTADNFNGLSSVVFDGINDRLSVATVPTEIHTGAEPREIWVLLSQDRPGSTAGTNEIVSIGDSGTAGDSFAVRRFATGGDNLAASQSGNGTANFGFTNINVDFTGIHAIRGIFDAEFTRVDVDTYVGSTAELTFGGIANTAMTVGASSTGGGIFLGKINKIAITTRLSQRQRKRLWNYYMTLGGILAS